MQRLVMSGVVPMLFGLAGIISSAKKAKHGTAAEVEAMVKKGSSP